MTNRGAHTMNYRTEREVELSELNEAQLATVNAAMHLAGDCDLIQVTPAAGLTPMPEGVFTLAHRQRNNAEVHLHPDGTLRLYYAPAAR